jgi:hypothetical protein
MKKFFKTNFKNMVPQLTINMEHVETVELDTVPSNGVNHKYARVTMTSGKTLYLFEAESCSFPSGISETRWMPSSYEYCLDEFLEHFASDTL